MLFNEYLQKIKTNWKSGLTVSLISIPLSLSLAVASNTSPVAGVVTAIWAGLIASLFGGSNYNIVGPTGALSGILASYAIVHGASALPMLAIISGVFILIAFVLRLERYLVFVPASTIHGFTLGVAFIIGLNQLNSATGIKVSVLHEKLTQNVFESLKNIQTFYLPSFILFLVALILLFVLPKIIKALPSAVVLSPFGLLFGYLVTINKIPFAITTLGVKYANLAPALFISHPLTYASSMVTSGLLVAFVAILETLLSARVADGITGTKHQKSKEIVGLGLANIVSGLMGGIPATAALARTALNIKSGATHKVSATINSLSVILISFVLIKYFVYMPMPVIASILVFVAIRMVEKERFVELFKFNKQDFYLSLIVCVLTVVQDPIIGILFGVSISSLLFLEKISHGQFELTTGDKNTSEPNKLVGDKINDEELNYSDETLVYTFEGELAYINSQSHIERFEKSLAQYKNVILRFRSVYFMDIDGVDAFDEIVEEIEKQGKKVLVSSVNNIVAPMLEYSENFLRLRKAGLVFNDTSKALENLGYTQLY